MPTSILTSKGQTTIPKQVRDFLQLRTGDCLEFIIDAEGRVIVRPATSDLSALDGLLDRSGSAPVSIETMHRAVEEAVSRPFRERP